MGPTPHFDKKVLRPMTVYPVRFLGNLARAALAAVVLAALAPAPAAAGETAPLVSPAWLKERLNTPDLLVLDIRSAIDGGGAEAYRKGHIPGAVHSDYDKAGWRVTRGNLPTQLPSVPELEKLVGETGIDEDVHVVVVPAGVHVLDFGAAARIYWTLKVLGHKQVSILDGGYAAWTADPANPVETEVRAPSPRIFTAEVDKTLLATTEEVRETAGRGTLVDARPAIFFLGKQKHPGAQAYGHIPGAVNIDSAALYDTKANRLKSMDELAAALAGVPSGPVTSYCNTGHWAATDWFVLSEVLGRKDVKLYPGSMVEWTADARRPVDSQRTKWDDLKKALGLGS
jgi:thiosulfate/3-mercaptopyruvate sulfurtransferase